jgi:hypothetical protein
MEALLRTTCEGRRWSLQDPQSPDSFDGHKGVTHILQKRDAHIIIFERCNSSCESVARSYLPLIGLQILLRKFRYIASQQRAQHYLVSDILQQIYILFVKWPILRESARSTQRDCCSISPQVFLFLGFEPWTPESKYESRAFTNSATLPLYVINNCWKWI